MKRGVFFVKSGPFPTKLNETDAGLIFILHFTYLGVGGAYAPNAPRAYGSVSTTALLSTFDALLIHRANCITTDNILV